MTREEQRIGTWAGILSALFAVVWFVTFVAKDGIHPVPHWTDLAAYADAFHIVRMTYVYPSLLLAITYIALLAAIYRSVREEQKIWALIATGIGFVYAAMASINYTIQAVAVRASLNAGEVRGIAMFIPDNPHSIFGALANSYVYLALSMAAMGFCFPATGLERWIRRLLFAQVITAVGQIGASMFDLSETIFLATSMVWVIGAPIVFLLIARWFTVPTISRATVNGDTTDGGNR